MIQFSNVSKSYGERELFQGITFSLGRGERLGLVGRNGSGKSTLFRLILDQEAPDSGTITKPRNYRIGHLAQHLHFDQENIVKEVCLGLPHDQRDEEYRAEILLAGLGFSERDMTLPASRFSGGFQIRIELARVLISEPNLLLLDEPTNYLDIVSARWLTRFLREWDNEMILISHDRDFLDAVTTHTMLIYRGGIRKISGGTEKMYEQIAVDEEVYEKTRVNEEKRRREVEVFINRFRAKATKAAAVQSRIKMLEKMGTKDALAEEEVLDFRFTETVPFHGRYLLEAKDVSFGYPAQHGEELPSDIIKNLSVTIAPGERVGVIGKNGKGKSTLLRIFAGELMPKSGSVSVNANARVGYFGQTNIARLNVKHTIEEEITQVNPQLHKTRVRNICGSMMFSGDDALKKISVLSGGEKSRVLLGKILALPTNLLFLDEPTNHLDMESIEALTDSVKEYQGAVVIVTHSEKILRELATKLIVFQDDKPTLVDGDYDYFLSKTGWREEGGEAPSDAASPPRREVAIEEENRALAPSPSQRAAEDKRERARLIAERSQVIGPLQKEMSSTENRIYALEAEVAKMNNLLIALSSKGDPKELTEVSRSMGAAQREIDELFSKLERVSAELEEKKKFYKALE